jgi:hypothetical protein
MYSNAKGLLLLLLLGSIVWGNSFAAGDSVVEGIYYQRWGQGERNYVFLSNLYLAYINPHSVKAKCFPMVPNNYTVQGSDPTYKLLEEHHHLILNSLAD